MTLTGLWSLIQTARLSGCSTWHSVCTLLRWTRLEVLPRELCPRYPSGVLRYIVVCKVYSVAPAGIIITHVLPVCCREEREKLNVWVAWMNLENLYGTQSTLMAVFQDAVQQNEPMEVYLQLVSIYENSDKFNVSIVDCVLNSLFTVLFLTCSWQSSCTRLQ